MAAEIEEKGYYELTNKELEHGAKLAWRNAPRCPGRIQWKNLTLFDNRHVETLEEVFQALCHHITFSTNGGNIKPAITVFRERIPGEKDKFRVWNKQLLAFAGYEQADGSIKGDPAYVDFTKFCQRLGWQGAEGRFDILPLVLSAEDHCPKFFPIPENIIKRVKIAHPKYPAIGKLGLEWFALPAVSGMCTEIGGIQFPAAPFSGWYSLPEVATRNLMDKQRFDMAEVFGKALELDTSSTTNLWRDRVNTEINIAVLDSYVKAGVTIVDHHTQADQFMEHFKQEYQTRGGCPSDWVWIVPPESGSLTTVFHQEMLNYHLTPSYDYQTELATVYKFPGQEKAKSFKSVARSVLFCKSLFRTVLSKRAKVIFRQQQNCFNFESPEK